MCNCVISASVLLVFLFFSSFRPSFSSLSLSLSSPPPPPGPTRRQPTSQVSRLDASLPRRRCDPTRPVVQAGSDRLHFSCLPAGLRRKQQIVTPLPAKSVWPDIRDHGLKLRKRMEHVEINKGMNHAVPNSVRKQSRLVSRVVQNV